MKIEYSMPQSQRCDMCAADTAECYPPENKHGYTGLCKYCFHIFYEENTELFPDVVAAGMNDSEGIVQAVIYDGSIESYNKLVRNIRKPESAYYHIFFIDEKGEMTPEFTGVVADTLGGVFYRPGDTYFVKVNDE